MRDLLLDLDERDGRRAGLERALREAIRDGRLPAGTMLPSTRAMSSEYSMARATVVAAYEQLVIEGYLVAMQGVGTSVADVRRSTPVPPEEGNPWPAAPSADFRPGEPDNGQFPRSTWAQAVRRILTETSDGDFGYADPRGAAALRSTLSEYLGRSRAAVARPQTTSVFGGVNSAFGFLAEVFTALGVERIAVEDPSLFFLRNVFALQGLTVVPIPVDDEGISVSALDAHDVGAVLVTPAHQFPLGVTMSAARRSALLSWARSKNAWIIEDDYDGEFRYDRRPIGALQGLDPERVIYAGTVSKMLSPALRLAWLVVPDELCGPLAHAKQLRGGVSTIEQLALADFIDRGDLDRHLRSTRTVYHHRREKLRTALNDVAPWLSLSSAEAGLHLAATIDDAVGLSEQQIVGEAARADVGLMGFGPWFVDTPTTEGLTIGYSRPAEHQFALALERLTSVLHTFG